MYLFGGFTTTGQNRKHMPGVLTRLACYITALPILMLGGGGGAGAGEQRCPGPGEAAPSIPSRLLPAAHSTPETGDTPKDTSVVPKTGFFTQHACR